MLREMKCVEASLLSALQKRNAVLVDLLSRLIAVKFDVIENSEFNSHPTAPLYDVDGLPPVASGATGWALP
jgi:hypothetical protein